MDARGWPAAHRGARRTARVNALIRFASSLGIGVAAAVLLAVACQSEAERLQAETVYHMEMAVQILERAAGNTEAAIDGLDKYLKTHEQRLLELRAMGSSVISRMSDEERAHFRSRSLDRARAVRERIETLARTFPDPPRVLAKVSQFM